MVRSELKGYLSRLDQQDKRFKSSAAENEIGRVICQIVGDSKLTTNEFAELFAFNVMRSNDSAEKSYWGTYYGPIFGSNYPPIEKVEPATINYWCIRAEESKNAVFKLRYADLVIDISRKLDRQPEEKLFEVAIRSSILVCENFLLNDISCIDVISRAYMLAIENKDNDLINITKTAMIRLEKNITNKAYFDYGKFAGLWGFSFDMLLLRQKKEHVNKEEEDELVGKLETLIKNNSKNIFIVSGSAYPLAEYYKNEKDEGNLLRILKSIESTSRYVYGEDAMMKTLMYSEINKKYKQYAGIFQRVAEEQKRIEAEFQTLDYQKQRSEEQAEEEERILYDVCIEVVEAVFDRRKNETLTEIMKRIALLFFHDANITQENCKEGYIFNLIKEIIFGPDNIEDGSIDEMLSNDRKQSKYRDSCELILPYVLARLKLEYTLEEVIVYFENSLNIDKAAKGFFRGALKVYWNCKYSFSYHAFVPIIENIMREQVVKPYSKIIEEDNNGHPGYYSLSRWLHDDERGRNNKCFDNAYGWIKLRSNHNVCERIREYLYYILVKWNALNLRNNCAHGDKIENAFNGYNSDLLFHIIVILSFAYKSK